MYANITVTGVVGPAKTLTAGVFSNCQAFSINAVTNILSINQADNIIDVAITAATTMTVTISGGNYTVSIS